MASGGGDSAGIRAAARRAKPAPDMQKQEDTRGDLFSSPSLPAGCPVVPLGKNQLQIYLLDYSKQLIPMDTRCEKGALIAIFGGEDWLKKHFPHWAQWQLKLEPGERGEPEKFDQAKVQAALVTACVRKGIFKPEGRVFGRGAHRAGEFNDELVLHMGNRVLIVGHTDGRGKPGLNFSEHPPGEVDGKFYPAFDALPPPAAEASTAAEARELLATFKQWYWVEPEAAPLLLLGLTAEMFLCGAFEWRSHGWLSAPTGSGKSTMLQLMDAIHAGWCLFITDGTEASIRQELGDATLPVVIDEAEADDNHDRQKALLNLAKKASSGGKIIRGGADHKAKNFIARSSFLMASVLHSLTKGEEVNRFALLELMQIPGTAADWEKPDLRHWRQVGRRMHRRMVEQWPRFARTKADYSREVYRVVADARWADTFGQLLACADCLLYDCAPSAESELNDEYGREKRYVQMVLPMLLKGKGNAENDTERCIKRLMWSKLDGENGKAPRTVSAWLAEAMRLNPALEDDGSGGINRHARDRLRENGMRLMTFNADMTKGGEPKPEPTPGEEWDNAYLAVAFGTCGPLRAMFRGTEWEGGRWEQSLGKLDGAVRKYRTAPRDGSTGHMTALKERFGGENPDNCIAIPLKALRGED